MELYEILHKPVPLKPNKQTQAEFDFVVSEFIKEFCGGDKKLFKQKYSCSWCGRHQFYRALRRKYGIEA